MVEVDATELVDTSFEKITKLNDEFSNVSERKIEKNKVSKFDDYNNLDEKIEKTLNEKYHRLLEKIVNKSFEVLNDNGKEFKTNRLTFSIFFLIFLPVQFIFIITLIILNGCDVLKLSDVVITTMIASLFVETLGVVTIMVRYVFNSESEIEIINAIQKVAEHYKK